MLTTSAYGANIQQYIDSTKKYTVTKNTEWEKLENIVLENSAKNQVVMFGEDHERRTDNDFVRKLLPKLKDQRFEYLALEIEKNSSTLGNKILKDYAYGKITREKIDQIWIDFEKIKATGWFDLIDAAKKAKIEIVCYDANPKEYSSWNKREEKAFNNLKELIKWKKESKKMEHIKIWGYAGEYHNMDNPNAKIIIYCGDDHLSEEPTYTPLIRMWEEKEGLTSNEKEAFKSLAFHINQFTKDKILTVGLRGLYIGPYHCDLKIDLKENIYKLQDHK